MSESVLVSAPPRHSPGNLPLPRLEKCLPKSVPPPPPPRNLSLWKSPRAPRKVPPSREICPQGKMPPCEILLVYVLLSIICFCII